jgi:Ca2+-binding RTX toxin-like protein
MVLPALAAGALLAAPAAASAEVDPGSVTTGAEIVAEAFDGAGETDPDRDRSGRIGFSEFLRTVNARDRNVDSGRGGKANVTQDTRLVEDGDLILGVDTSGTADSSYTDPNPSDSLEPYGSGTSELAVGFEVVNAPVQFTLTGSIEASVSGNGAGNARVTVTDPTGAEHKAEVASFESGSDVVDLDLTNTISPGSHDFEVDIDVFSGGHILSGGTSTADYDLELRFCTVVVEQPGQAALGTSGDDVICGRSGNEQLLGGGGNDIMLGLGGADDIDGGIGADEIFGGAGDDTRLYGGPGNDDIDAGPGNDGPGAPSVGEVVAGGPGSDTIDGGAGDDRLYGRCGEFLLGEPSPVCPDDPPAPGESDQDKLVGHSGADVLFGDADRDSILAGKGNDALVEGFAGLDFIAGGPGNDSLDGGEGNDEILGEDGRDTLLGAGGNDCLDGGSKQDEFSGGADDDKLLAKDGGRDTGSGGPGPDRGRFDAADAIASVAVRSFQGGC